MDPITRPCICCAAPLTFSRGHFAQDLKTSGGWTIFDMSNGLESLVVCAACAPELAARVRALIAFMPGVPRPENLAFTNLVRLAQR